MEASSLPILWPTPSIFRLALLFLRVNIISIGFNLNQTRCYANHNSAHYYQCPSSFCGNISNISYPFRLDTYPEQCGDHRLSISCEENNTLPVLHWDSGRYHVQSIDYTIRTIRLVDLDVFKYNCSFIPSYSLDSRDYFSTSLSTNVSLVHPLYGHDMLGMVECENIPVNSSSLAYLDTSACDINLTPCRPYSYQYSYYIWGSGAILAADLEDGCRIRFMTPAQPLSTTEESSTLCLQIHDGIVNGFESSWTIDDTAVQESPDFRWYVDLYYHWYNDFSGKLYCLCGCCHYLSWRPCVFLDSITKGRDRKDWFETYLAPDRSVKIFNVLMMAVALIVSLIIAKITIGIPCVIVFLIYKWRRRHLSMYHNIEEFLQSNNIMPIRYSYFDIRKMAKGFKDKLGAGGFGSVYKGKLRSGRLVAIKLLGETKSTNGQDFINEVATIGRIHHVNVVRLVGFCVERSKRALVYDFMPNGSLDKYIFSQGGSNSIDCKKMCEISIGVASGIEYLHRGCNMQILHFDIKPHNILLDQNFVPKVSDFGLARLCPLDNITVSLTAARGTVGYMAPELFYKNIGGVSYKADVYSFGVLLMEIASRRKSLNADAEHTSQIYFPSWAFDQITEGKDIEMENVTEEESKIRKKMIIVALWCIQLKPSDRPSMKKVKEMLEGDFESLQMPPKPFLCPQEKATGAVKEKSSSPLMLPKTLSDYDDSSETKQFLNANW